MTPDQILTFAAVAEYGSISVAAQHLHLTQPAVSGQLRLLQESFGQPLYRRSGRGIALTTTGEHLAVIARQMRQSYERARNLRQAITELREGSLAIGASTTPASYLLPYMVADFRQKFPGIVVTLSSGNTADILEEVARFDIAFIEDAAPAALPPNLGSFTWCRDEVVAIVRPDHPLALKLGHSHPAATSWQPATGDAPAPALSGAATLKQLSTYPIVMRETGSGLRRQVTEAFTSAGLTMQIAIELAGVEGVKEGVRAGLGVGFVSAMAMQHGDPTLVPLRVGPPHGIGRHISVLVPHADTLSASTRGFLETFFSSEWATL